MKSETTYVERLQSRQKQLNGDKMYVPEYKNRFQNLERIKPPKNSIALNKKLLGIDPLPGLLPRSYRKI